MPVFAVQASPQQTAPQHGSVGSVESAASVAASLDSRREGAYAPKQASSASSRPAPAGGPLPGKGPPVPAAHANGVLGRNARLPPTSTASPAPAGMCSQTWLVLGAVCQKLIRHMHSCQAGAKIDRYERANTFTSSCLGNVPSIVARSASDFSLECTVHSADPPVKFTSRPVGNGSNAPGGRLGPLSSPFRIAMGESPPTAAAASAMVPRGGRQTPPPQPTLNSSRAPGALLGLMR